MWADWQINGLLSVGQGIGSYIVQRAQAKTQKKWQEYNNKMVNLQNAQNQNAININQNQAVKAATEKSYQTSVAAYQTKAKATVAAAAVGAEGNSVDLVMRDIQHSEDNAQAKIKEDLILTGEINQQQRVNSAFAAKTSVDYTQIPKPNLASSLLNIGTDVGTGWLQSLKLNR